MKTAIIFSTSWGSYFSTGILTGAYKEHIILLGGKRMFPFSAPGEKLICFEQEWNKGIYLFIYLFS